MFKESGSHPRIGESKGTMNAEAAAKIEAMIKMYNQPMSEAAMNEPYPSDLRRGMMLSVTNPCKKQVKEEAKCQKCQGSGLWVNPKDNQDKRTCFACHGKGGKAIGKKKGEDGKLVWEVIPAGTIGEIMGWRSFGTFFANGYNKPNRDNTTVTLKVNGRIIDLPLAKLSVAR